MKKLTLTIIITLAAGIGFAQIPVEITNVRAPNTPEAVADQIPANAGDIIYDSTNGEFQFYDGVVTGGVKFVETIPNFLHTLVTGGGTPLENGQALYTAVTNAQAIVSTNGFMIVELVASSPYTTESKYLLPAPFQFDSSYTLTAPNSNMQRIPGFYFSGYNEATASRYATLDVTEGTNFEVVMEVPAVTSPVANQNQVINGLSILGSISNSAPQSAGYMSFRDVLFNGAWYYSAATTTTPHSLGAEIVFQNCGFYQSFSFVNNTPAVTTQSLYLDIPKFIECQIAPSTFGPWYVKDGWFYDCDIDGTAEFIYYPNTVDATGAATAWRTDVHFYDCRFTSSAGMFIPPAGVTTLSGTAAWRAVFENCTFNTTSATDPALDATGLAKFEFYGCKGVPAVFVGTGAIIRDSVDVNWADIVDQN
jgi:hypothetical protein